MAANTIQITPFMHVTEIAPAVRFFTEILGCTAPVVAADYAYVEREGAGLRIQAHADPAELGTPHGGFAIISMYATWMQCSTRLAQGSPRCHLATCTARWSRAMDSENC